MTPSLPPALLLMGPTASGKTALALALATTLQARGQAVEIISVDSALVYRDMNIGTAKPTAAELATCPHHLIDICTPLEAYSAAAFRADACRLMTEITQRGALPILVGGTMLYFKALRDGLSDLPAADPALRRRIEDDATRLGWPALHAELARHDAAAAARLHPADAQRIQRALEIVLVTGRPLADSYAQREAISELPCQLLPVALVPSDRSVLHARIAQRFDQMLADGFIDEVRQLRQHWPALQADMTSMRCVGYRQVWDWLDGTLTCHHSQGADQELRAQGIAATRQLAKRQLTWLRQFSEQWQELMVIDCFSAHLLATVVALYDSVTATRA